MSPDDADAKKKAGEAYAENANAKQTPAQGGAADGEVRDHNLSPLAEGAVSGEAGNIDLLMDITVPVVAQLGATEMRIRDILQLLPGSIVDLDKLAGDPVDLYVRGKLFAQGEVVVVDESFGIRVSKIIDSQEQPEALAG